MENNPNTGFDMSALRQFADSDEGRKIINLISAKDNGKIQEAISKAYAGEMRSAKEIIENLLSEPEIKAALPQIGEKNGR